MIGCLQLYLQYALQYVLLNHFGTCEIPMEYGIVNSCQKTNFIMCEIICHYHDNLHNIAPFESIGVHSMTFDSSHLV